VGRDGHARPSSPPHLDSARGHELVEVRDGETQRTTDLEVRHLAAGHQAPHEGDVSADVLGRLLDVEKAAIA
jgi:hypothetical protein